MRMSDEEYFRSCVAKERRLAQLLGHEVEEYYETAGTLWENTAAMPKWTRDWNACGPLIAEYELEIVYHKEPGQEHNSSVTVGPVHVLFSDHPTKDQAIRFAIVKAVVARLEHEIHEKHKGHGKAEHHSHHSHHSHH